MKRLAIFLIIAVLAVSLMLGLVACNKLTTEDIGAVAVDDMKLIFRTCTGATSIKATVTDNSDPTTSISRLITITPDSKDLDGNKNIIIAKETTVSGDTTTVLEYCAGIHSYNIDDYRSATFVNGVLTDVVITTDKFTTADVNRCIADSGCYDAVTFINEKLLSYDIYDVEISGVNHFKGKKLQKTVYTIDYNYEDPATFATKSGAATVVVVNDEIVEITLKETDRFDIKVSYEYNIADLTMPGYDDWEAKYPL